MNNWILFKNKAALSCKWGGESISELSFNRRHVGQLKFSSHTSDTSFLQTSPGNPSVISILVFCILWILRDFFCDWFPCLGLGSLLGRRMKTSSVKCQITRTDAHSSHVAWKYTSSEVCCSATLICRCSLPTSGTVIPWERSAHKGWTHLKNYVTLVRGCRDLRKGVSAGAAYALTVQGLSHPDK